jgi:hypothetical protein
LAKRNNKPFNKSDELHIDLNDSDPTEDHLRCFKQLASNYYHTVQGEKEETSDYHLSRNKYKIGGDWIHAFPTSH